ncbi:unnamed protein product [Mytilus coruscus]|uniref:VLIG-type G domain-containing protein n=1 Tax=Mytilus coruscus TaxID=42192 RepID=A0A6J8A109_MYTCO|nr:unnamed protein product [Mytilus coruscus]
MGATVDKEEINSDSTDPPTSLRTEFGSVGRENVRLDEDSSNDESEESASSIQGDENLSDVKEFDNMSGDSNVTENLEKCLNIKTENKSPEIEDICPSMEATHELSDKPEEGFDKINKTEDKQTLINCRSPVPQRQTDIRTFMSKVGLDMMYPDKITLMDVMTIQSQPETSSYTDVPMMVLKNLMMINSTSRDKMLQEFLEKIPKEDDSMENSELFNENDDIWLELGICETHENLNPLDLLLAIFMCSSPSLKNILAAKLFMCKLAIPFLVPSETDDLILNCSLLHSIIMDDKTDKTGIRQKMPWNAHVMLIVKNVGNYFTKDEDSIVHRKAIEKAKHIISDIPNDIINVKPLIAPLQGTPWQVWSKKSKLIHKASKFTSLQDMAKHEEEMKNQRYFQLDALRNLHPFMQKCLNAFLDSVNDDSEFVLLVEWMKFLLDDRSRYVVAECLTKYQLAFQIFESAKREGSEISEVEKDLKEKRSDLNNAPFRFEHLLRECGQIFKSIKACKEKASVSEQKLLTMLPKFAAKLLLIGQPLEILDGDVTHVPLLWIEAVLLQLRDLIGDKRLLALSVVGLQSSGKSTLLNTMFGLQFAVNVGRCTSGVFMQLVPVNNDSSNFDYVIVIDTEGLRSPKQDETEELSHDNMLATFVIGLGDVAMINVKGENTSEVKDILQIAVHAFLRLKLANRKLNLKQSCVLFIKMFPILQQMLKCWRKDRCSSNNWIKWLKEAAEQEDIADIKTFSQIIDFNSEENVSYFSDLWHGDPPMAPVNPGYSNRVAEVKNSILNKIASKRTTYLTITDTISRIQDLWNGIIKDNFVYSFRNSLELKAYNGIEREYHSMVWEMEKFQYEFLVSTAKSKLSHANVKRLDETVSEIMRAFSG